jgi:hypothetical protein
MSRWLLKESQRDYQEDARPGPKQTAAPAMDDLKICIRR